MLLGQYDGKLGEKNRIIFPKRLRDELGERLIITYGYENHLSLSRKKVGARYLRELKVGHLSIPRQEKFRDFSLEEQVSWSLIVREGLLSLLTLERLQKLKMKLYS